MYKTIKVFTEIKKLGFNHESSNDIFNVLKVLAMFLE
jgi:hypothetical protein